MRSMVSCGAEPKQQGEQCVLTCSRMMVQVQIQWKQSLSLHFLGPAAQQPNNRNRAKSRYLRVDNSARLIATAMRSYQRISSSNLEAQAVLHSQHQQLDWQAGSIWAVYLVSLIEDYREVLS